MAWQYLTCNNLKRKVKTTFQRSKCSLTRIIYLLPGEQCFIEDLKEDFKLMDTEPSERFI